MEISVFNILTYFIIYSFLGWVMESIVRSICEKKVINTGFLEGPFCPIYGFGAIIMVLFLSNFKNMIVLFVVSVVVLTFWEYIVGFLLEKIFKTKYWDYSDHKFNIQGRVCLINSLCWGVLGIAFTKYIHPFIVNLLGYIDATSLKIAVYAIVVIFIVDTIISVVKVLNIKTTLRKIEELNNQIKQKLSEIKNIEKTKKFENNLLAVVEKMKVKRDRSLRRLYRHVYRLKKTFPAIDTKEFAEVLSRKIEIHKNKEKEK